MGGCWPPCAGTVIAQISLNSYKLSFPFLARYLQLGLGLEVDARKPIVACVTRLVPQKVTSTLPPVCLSPLMKHALDAKAPLCAQGIHLIRHAVYRTLQLGGQFVLLGSGHADGDFRWPPFRRRSGMIYNSSLRRV